MQVGDPTWPQKEDYDDAMKKMTQNVRDPVIKSGKLEQDKAGIVRYGGANNYVTLYKVNDTATSWMVRCFCRDDARKKQPPLDILTRYQHISDFCKAKAGKLSPVAHIEQIPAAINVDFIDRQNPSSYVLLKTEVLPWVRMEFIQGLPLGTFITKQLATLGAKHHENILMMQALCDAWLHMISYLEAWHIAHGDMDLTNIIVQEHDGNIILKLIDYDNAWVPAFGAFPEKLKQTEMGHEHFQHPAFQSKETRAFNEYMDRFSALTMYISLRALTMYPNLYTNKEWGAGDSRLLLSSTDYKAEMQSSPNHITLLRNSHLPELDPLLEELSLCLLERRNPLSLTQLLPLNSKFVLPSHQIGFEVPVTLPATENDIVEVSIYNFDQAIFTKKLDEPLVPSYQLEPETEQAAICQQPRSPVGSIVLWLIALILVALIIFAILWFTGVIHHTAITSSWTLPLPTQDSTLRHWLFELSHRIVINM